MNDTYVECLVARKKNPILPILKYFLYGLAVLCLLVSMITSMPIIMFALGLIFAGVAYFVLPRFDLEFEYLYLDKEISIDKVMAKEKRKHVATIDLNKVEKIAVSRSHELDSYKSRNHKEVDFSSKEADAKTYTIPFEDNGELTLYTLEMNEEMIKAIKTVFPRKVVEY